MVIANVRGKKSLQVALVEGNDVIQQIPTTALDPSFRYPVLPGTPERCPHRTDGHGAHGDQNLHAILGVPVEEFFAPSK
jgi:hypothetical protein